MNILGLISQLIGIKTLRLTDSTPLNQNLKFGKFKVISGPFKAKAAMSYAAAAISGLLYVPSQMRVVLRGSRISETHLPHLLREPLYI